MVREKNKMNPLHPSNEAEIQKIKQKKKKISMLGQGRPYRHIYLYYQDVQLQDKSLYSNWTFMINKELIWKVKYKSQVTYKKGKSMGHQLSTAKADTRIWEELSPS